jgi:hypothetical protein
MAEFGQDHLVVPYRSLGVTHLVELVSGVLENEGAIKATIESKLPKVQERSSESLVALRGALDG